MCKNCFSVWSQKHLKHTKTSLRTLMYLKLHQISSQNIFPSFLTRYQKDQGKIQVGRDHSMSFNASSWESRISCEELISDKVPKPLLTFKGVMSKQNSQRTHRWTPFASSTTTSFANMVHFYNIWSSWSILNNGKGLFDISDVYFSVVSKKWFRCERMSDCSICSPMFCHRPLRQLIFLKFLKHLKDSFHCC